VLAIAPSVSYPEGVFVFKKLENPHQEGLAGVVPRRSERADQELDTISSIGVGERTCVLYKVFGIA
jgi:hypothetical protein